MNKPDRFEAYILFKNMLSKYGAIPKTEQDYERLMGELLELFDKK